MTLDRDVVQRTPKCFLALAAEEGDVVVEAAKSARRKGDRQLAEGLVS